MNFDSYCIRWYDICTRNYIGNYYLINLRGIENININKLIGFLHKNKQVIAVNLCGTGLDDNGLSKIAMKLADGTLSHIKKLILSNNKITNEGLIMFDKILSNPDSEFDWITYHVEIFSNAHFTNSKIELEGLIFSHNNINGVGLNSLYNVLIKNNIHLKELSLSGINLDKPAVESFSKLMETNIFDQLNNLELVKCDLDKEDIMLILDKAKLYLPKLQKFLFIYNFKISDAEKKQLDLIFSKILESNSLNNDQSKLDNDIVIVDCLPKANNPNNNLSKNQEEDYILIDENIEKLNFGGDNFDFYSEYDNNI